MKILITGSKGFIGRHLVARLSSLPEHQVFAFADDVGRLSSVQCKANCVVHLASRVIPSKTPAGADLDMLRNNTLAMASVIDYCRSHGAALIFVSSSAVYKAPSQPVLTTERDETSQENLNGFSKLLAEDLFQTASQNGCVSGVILRLFNVYGEGQREPFLIPYVLNQLTCGQPLHIRNLHAVRDYVHVDDVCTAIIRSLIHIPSAGIRTFNIGSGQGTSTHKILDLINSLSSRTLKIEEAPGPQHHEVLHMVANIIKAQTILDWAPRIELEEGLRHLVQTTLLQLNSPVKVQEMRENDKH